MGYVNDIFDQPTLATLPGHDRDRPHALFDRRREQAVERAADRHRLRARPGRASATTATSSTPTRFASGWCEQGSIFQTNSDTEVVVHLYRAIAGRRRSTMRWSSRSRSSPARFRLRCSREDHLIAARDPHGFRPLALGKLGEAWVVCSETCALDLINATYVRDVEPGEVRRDRRRRAAFDRAVPAGTALALRVRARLFRAARQRGVRPERQRSAHQSRAAARAAKRGVAADVVVPDSRLGRVRRDRLRRGGRLPLRFGLIRNHYVGRTFIEPAQSIRHFGVKVKLNPVKSILAGQRVVLIDDSIVRGTTSRKIVKMVRAAGAREVHLRISCPPTISPCFYGVDTPRRQRADRGDAFARGDSQVRRRRLARLSQPRGLDGSRCGRGPYYCTSCYTGQYPVAFPRDQNAYLQLTLEARWATSPAARRRA